MGLPGNVWSCIRSGDLRNNSNVCLAFFLLQFYCRLFHTCDVALPLSTHRLLQKITLFLTLKDRYSEVSADWRHRDNLTWQLPTILFALTGAIFAAILKLRDDTSQCSFDSIFTLLYFLGFLLSIAFSIMLFQNLWSQVVSIIYL